MKKYSCYDCLHCEACSDEGDAGFSALKEDVSKCKHFKNKTDFVEVIRCKDCDFCIKVDEPQTIMYPDKTRQTYFLRCRVFNNFCVENEFCSLGKRRDT